MNIDMFGLIFEGLNLFVLFLGAGISIYVVTLRGRVPLLLSQKVGIFVFWFCEIAALGIDFLDRQNAGPLSSAELTAAENLMHALGIITLTLVVWQLVPQMIALKASADDLDQHRRDLEGRQKYETELNVQLEKIYQMLSAGHPDFIPEALRITSKAIDIGRVGFAISKDDPDRLHTICLYDCLSQTHAPAGVFDRAEHPYFRECITTSKFVAAKDSVTDPRVAELRESYLLPNGIRSICYISLAIPQSEAGSIYGETIEQYRDWTFEEISFLRSVGDAMMLYTARQQLTERNKALEKSRAEFQAIADYTHNWEALISPEGILTWTNTSAERFTGYTIEECLGRDDFPMFLGETDQDKAELQEIRDRIDAGLDHENKAVRIVRKDGKEEWLLFEWRVVDVDNQHITGTRVSASVVSRRVNAERSLAITQKEQRKLDTYLQAFLQTTPTAVIQTTPARQIVAWNPSAAEIFGWASIDAVGQKIDMLFRPEMQEEIESLYASAQTEGWSRSGVGPSLRKDGREIICEWHDSIIVDETGKPVTMFSVATDITERVEQRDRLQREEQRIREFSNAASDFFWETNAVGQFTYLSSRYFDLTEDADTHVADSRAIGDVFDSDDESNDLAAILSAISDRVAFRDVFITRREASGRRLRLAVSGIPVFDEAGVFSGYRGTGRDIGGELRQALMAQMISTNVHGLSGEDYFTALVQSMQMELQVDWIFVGEISSLEDGRVNVIAGVGPDGEIVPFSYPLKDSASMAVCLAEGPRIIARNAPVAYPGDWILKEKNIQGHGGMKLTDDAGNLVGIIVTEAQDGFDDPDLVRSALEIFGARAGAELSRRRTEARNAALQSQLMHTQRMETMGALAGGIAHDFNNILTPIMGYSELLAQSLPQDTENQQDAQAILRGARRAKALVKQILDFSRREDSSENVTFDIVPLIKGIATFVTSTMPPDIALETSFDEEHLFITGDPAKIDQVLMNLLTNAWHAMDEDSGTISITVSARRPDKVSSPLLGGTAGNVVRIEVGDTGCGIEEHLLERIFEPFFTTKGSGSGTGFGLSTARGIVQAMGGVLEAESTIGTGSTFTVILPSAAAIDNADAESGLGADAVLAAAQLDKLRILYVDDEVQNNSVAVRMLETAGHSVVCFDRPMEALAAIRKDPFGHDVLITDDSMPAMTGSELSRQVLEINPNLSIVVVSGGSLGVLDERYGPLGVTTYLAKPFGMRDLTSAIDDAKVAGARG